jgi:hemoglobin
MSASLTPATIGQLVAKFYGRARADELLGPVFEAAIVDWDAHLDHLTRFWCSVLLGERGFTGNPMAAHARHPIRPEMFDRWLALWGETARELFPAETAQRLQARAAQIGESLKLGLFFRASQA